MSERVESPYAFMTEDKKCPLRGPDTCLMLRSSP